MKKPRRKQPQNTRRAARSAQGAIVLLGIYLLVVFFSGLILVQLLSRTQERFLADYLGLVGRSIAEPPREYFYFLEFLTDPETGQLSEEELKNFQGTFAWENLADSLRSASSEAFVERLHLLTPGGQVILDGSGPPPDPASRDQFAEEGTAAISQAAEGETVSLPREGRSMQRTVYMPVRNKQEQGGRVVALLRIESGTGQFAELARLRRRLFVGFWISIGILVFLYIATIRLIRRTINAERAASQADRLRALGTMTAGIAHEIRNPLGILTLQIEELRETIRQVEDRDQRASLASIAEDLASDTKRLKGLTEQFVSFGSGGAEAAGETRPAKIDAAEAARQLLKIWKKSVDPQRREIVEEIAEDSLPVFFTEDALRQILLNILRNADEALGDQSGQIKVRVFERDGYAAISVEDTGPGIDPAMQRQLFDPFFTTKADGTGLGLSLSRSLAQRAGGDLTVESTPGEGARFALLLPLYEE